MDNVMIRTLDFCYKCPEEHPCGEIGSMYFNEEKMLFYCMKCGGIDPFFRKNNVHYKILTISEFIPELIDLKARLMEIKVECYYVFDDEREMVYARFGRFSPKRFLFWLMARRIRKMFLVERISTDRA